DHWQIGRIFRARNIVRMDHGGAAVEPFHLARYDDGLTFGQHFLQPRQLRVEEGQRNFACLVMREDAMRDISASGRRWLVLVDSDFERDDCTLRRVDDAGAISPVYYAMRGQK